MINEKKKKNNVGINSTEINSTEINESTTEHQQSDDFIMA